MKPNYLLHTILATALGSHAYADPTTGAERSMKLSLESSIDGKPWHPVDLSTLQVLPDGRLWMPYLDHQVSYRLQPSTGETETPVSLSRKSSPAELGSFLTLEQSSDLSSWSPMDGNSIEAMGASLALPNLGERGFWRIDYGEVIPDPFPLPPLQVQPNPEVIFGGSGGSGPLTPPLGLGGYFGEFIGNPPEPVPFPGPHAFNKYIFEERVHQSFEGDVKGYAVVIANEDDFQGKVSGGWARGPADGGVRMTTFRPGNVGSVAKLFSGVAMMQLLEEIPGMDLNAALDLAIGPYLPQRWLDTVDDDHQAITFGELLDHSAGLDDAGSDNAPDNISDNPSYFHFTQPIEGPGYRNEHSRIMTYLIPRLAYPEEMLQAEADNEDLGFNAYLDNVMVAYGLAFQQYMEDEFFPQVAGTCAPSPDPANDYAPNQSALMYLDPSDFTGLEWNQVALTGFARAQGGYWCTAQELARFLQSTHYTDDLLKPAASDMLVSNPSWLINNSSVINSDFDAELGANRWRYKPGLQESGLEPYGTGRGLAMSLPYDWVCSVVVNSDSARDKDSGDGVSNRNSANDIVAGFYDATRDVPMTISREAMRMSTFLDVSAYLRERHMEVLWLDVYDIKGTPFVNATFGKAAEPVAGAIGMNGQEYEDFLHNWVTVKGFAVQQVESYLDHGKIRYAAIITEEDRPEQRAYHGWSYAAHQAKAQEWSDLGFVPINVSVVSLNGQRRYTALYEERQVQASMLTRLDAFEYDEEFEDFDEAGMKVVSLNAYRHMGRRYYAAIWHKRNGAQGGIHEADRDAYRAADATQLNNGALPVIITGVDSGTPLATTNARHRFGAVWR